jgi:hypothetical protein
VLLRITGAEGGAAAIMRILMEQQVLAAWVSAGAAIVQAVGAIGAILVAVKLARDSERRAIEAEQASAAREREADRAAVARAEAADRAAEQRVARSLLDQRSGMIDSIITLACELLEEVDEACAAAAKYEDHGGTVSGTHSPKQTPALEKLIPTWKLDAKDAGLVKAISRFERAIQPWSTPPGGYPGPGYAALFRDKRDEIDASIKEIEACKLTPR